MEVQELRFLASNCTLTTAAKTKLCDRCCLSVCQSFVVCLLAGVLLNESADFIETWCYYWAYQSQEMINFW